MNQEFLTVPTMLRGMYRQTEGEHSPVMYKGSTVPASAGLRDELLASARPGDVMARFLAEMDRKLDAVLAMLQRDALVSSFPGQGYVVELSGSGALFETASALEPGAYLELLLLLDEYPMRIVPVLARVDQRKSTKPLTGAAHSVYAVQFTRVEAEDRETVIRFVFSEDRKRIRRSKSDV